MWPAFSSPWALKGLLPSEELSQRKGRGKMLSTRATGLSYGYYHQQSFPVLRHLLDENSLLPNEQSRARTNKHKLFWIELKQSQ